jgi:hypothetical protein
VGVAWRTRVEVLRGRQLKLIERVLLLLLLLLLLPGMTKTINHFLINDSWYLVDLPGYG